MKIDELKNQLTLNFLLDIKYEPHVGRNSQEKRLYFFHSSGTYDAFIRGSCTKKKKKKKKKSSSCLKNVIKVLETVFDCAGENLVVHVAQCGAWH